MPSAGPRLTLVCILAAVAGCGHTSALERRFRHDTGCSYATVQSIGGSSFEVSGCGYELTYTCARRTAYDEPVCVREVSLSELREAVNPRASRTPATTGSSAVERAFDAERKLHVVRARFGVNQPRAELRMTGAPAQELTSVFFTVILRGTPSAHDGCSTLHALVNGEPIDGREIKVAYDRESWGTRASGRFEFERFRPLAREFTELGIEACGQRFKLSGEQMNDVRKFFAIFSQIALDVQAERDAAGEPAKHGQVPGAVEL